MTDNTVYTVVSDNDRPGTANSNGFFEKNAVLPNTPGASIDNTTYAVDDIVNGNGSGNGTGSFYEKNTTIEALVFSTDALPVMEAEAAAAAASEAGASSSATAAAASAASALASKNAAATSETNAASSATAASGSATAASGSATAAAGSASAAATSASNAGTSATNAASSATTATTQAGIATTQAGNAATSATNAASSASAAATSATNAAAAVQAAAGTATPLVNGTAAVGTGTKWSHEDHVHPTDTTRAPLASPGLTGTPTAPTATVDTNTTQLATTAFILAQAASATPGQSVTAGAVGTSTRFARGDHTHPQGAILTDLEGITPAQGDIIYRNATNWTKLAAGTSGNFLKTQGAGANPIWDVPAGGGGSTIGKNYLSNPSGEINQRGAASQTDVTYDFDRWLTLTQTAAITASSVADAENSTPFMMRSLQAQATAQRYGRIQWLEQLFCRDLRGQSVTLSGRVRMSAATTLRYAIVEWTGTADAITKDIVLSWTSATFTAGNFFTSTSTTVVATGSIALSANTLTDITALTGTVSSSMNNLAVFFWTDSAQAQNVTLDIGKVKLEKGSAATAFVSKPYAQELIDCLRYYYKRFGARIDDAWSTFQTFSTTKGWGIVMNLPVPMRAGPTVTTSAVGDFSLWGTTAAAEIPCTAMVLVSSPTSVAATSVTVASGLTVGSASVFSANSTSGWMAMSAEL